MKQNQLMQITVQFKNQAGKIEELSGNPNVILETLIIEYTSKIQKDPKSLVFIYYAKQLRDDDFKKSLIQVIQPTDKREKRMCILVVEKQNDSNNNTNITSNKIIKTFLNRDKRKSNYINNNNNFPYNDSKYNLRTNNNTLMGNNQANNINNNETMIPKNNFPQVGIIDNPVGTSKCECIKKNKNRIICISVIAALIIAGVIIAIVQLVKKKDKNSSSTNPGEKDNDPDETSKPTEDPGDSTKNIICNTGYFIPDDDSTCQKCSLEGCAKCSGTTKSNTCIDCGDFKTVIEGEKIIRCNDPNKPCEEGEEDKCLTCDTETNECKECNIAYKLVDGICRPNYLIKAVYFTKQNDDKINIINDYSDIVYMYVEGEKITPRSTNYQFKDEGYQTVYFLFENTFYFFSGLFRNNRHIKSVSFSNFNEYLRAIPLNSMFAGCTNLTSVDFSKLSYIISSNMEYMFNGCINLTYVNLNNLKAGYSIEYIFNNCVSLTSIDLSKFDISSCEDLNHMFSNCTSLQNIDLKGFKIDSATTIHYMFYNCYSLKSLDLSSFKPSKLSNINSAFYNCSSLTSINFLDFYSELAYMANLFYNCSSLKQIDLTYFNTKRVNNMINMFNGCKSLTSIITGVNFDMNNVQYISAMFAHCHSLKSITFDLKVTNKVSDISSFFDDCHSLTSVNLKNFDTSKVNDFSYMFHNCYDLKTIDITNFKFKEKDNIKGMFSGCYSITSIDFSSVQPNYYLFDEIFFDCPNLNYVNFSFIRTFTSWYSWEKSYYIFNENISESGTFIINEGYYNTYLKDLNKYPPKGWTLNFTN